MLLYRSGAGYDPRICHTLTVPSDAADARASPCGLNHTPATKPVWPVSEATFRPVELDKSSMSAWFVTIATRSPVSWNRQFTALSMCARLPVFQSVQRGTIASFVRDERRTVR